MAPTYTALNFPSNCVPQHLREGCITVCPNNWELLPPRLLGVRFQTTIITETLDVMIDVLNQTILHQEPENFSTY